MSTAHAPMYQGQPYGQPAYMQPPQWSIGDMLFGFSGRINRGKWWLSLLVSVVASIAFTIVFGLLGAAVGEGKAYFAVKRLRDMNHTGHWMWLFYALPMVLFIVATAVSVPLLLPVFERLGQDGAVASEADIIRILSSLGPIWLSLLASSVIGLVYVIWLGCIRGTRGPNAYGADPIPHVL